MVDEQHVGFNHMHVKPFEHTPCGNVSVPYALLRVGMWRSARGCAVLWAALDPLGLAHVLLCSPAGIQRAAAGVLLLCGQRAKNVSFI
jgi:hypothetical protein